MVVPGGTVSHQRGFLGCISTLTINGVTFDLEGKAKTVPGVSSGCPGYCSGSSSLCHNRGRCIEKSNGYTCDCSQSAYGGPTCKEGEAMQPTNINQMNLQINPWHGWNLILKNTLLPAKTVQGPNMKKAPVQMVVKLKNDRRDHQDQCRHIFHNHWKTVTKDL